MDIKAPVSSLMTSELITVDPKDPIRKVKEAFDQHTIHHLPVEVDGEIVGIISKSDLMHFLRAIDKNSQEQYINELRLKNYKVEELMIDEIVTLTPDAPVENALRLFKENRFHALPIVDNGKLAGILTTHDIIKSLLDG